MASADRTIPAVALLAMQVRQRLVDELVPRGFDATLRRACAVASYTLAQVITQRVTPVTFVRGFFDMNRTQWAPHCWIEVDQHVVDITATQFGSEYAAVRILKLDDTCRPRAPRRYIPEDGGVSALAEVNRRWLTSPRTYGAIVERIVAELGRPSPLRFHDSCTQEISP
jgi:hypothetical protein